MPDDKPKATFPQLVAKVKDVSIFVLIGIVVALLVTVKNFSESVEYLKGKYEATYMIKERKLDMLAQLRAGGPKSRIIGILGAPDIVSKVAGKPVVCNTFLDPQYIVSVYVGVDSLVLAYSVTTRDASFKPAVPLPMESGAFKGVPPKLWAESYLDFANALGQDPAASMQGIWASRCCYLDEHSFGRPGNFQTLCLYSVETGVEEGGNMYDPPDRVFDFKYTYADSKVPASLKQYRKLSRPNSFLLTAYGVTLQDVVNKEDPMPLGPQFAEISASELRARGK